MNQNYSPRSGIRLRRSVVTFVLAVFALIACVEPPAPVPPTIASFVANPPATGPGMTVTLSWQVTGAGSLRLMPGGDDVTGLTQFGVSVDATTSFTLVAENAIGATERSITVPVGPIPMISAFESSNRTEPDGGPVNPGLPTTLEWTVDGADIIELRGPGLGIGIDVTGTTSYDVDSLALGALYELVATNAFGTVVSDEVLAARAVPAFSVLVAGQSNAQGVNVSSTAALAYVIADPNVRMLGNDYVWKAAYEPLDDCTNQVDLVSADPGGPCATFAINTSGVSPGVSMGNAVTGATQGTVFLIPAALGGSGTGAWQPRPDRYDRAFLFGSAAHRARLAGDQQGAPLGGTVDGSAYGAVLWYQGETDSSSLTQAQAFAGATTTILDAFRDELDAPILLVQLSRRGPVPGDGDGDDASRNLLYQIVRESQRRMETGARTPAGSAASQARQETYLVVTHDLPMSDGRHLSADGQLELGRRLGLAVRQHLLGESVDGSGPRLVEVVTASTTVVRVIADRPITAPAATGAGAYSNYFAVFSGGAEVPITQIVRDPSNDRAVRITLGQAVAGSVEVRYMPPPGTITTFVGDVIRSASCTAPQPDTNSCLPMPAFGAVTDASTTVLLQLYVAPESDER